MVIFVHLRNFHVITFNHVINFMNKTFIHVINFINWNSSILYGSLLSIQASNCCALLVVMMKWLFKSEVILWKLSSIPMKILNGWNDFLKWIDFVKIKLHSNENGWNNFFKWIDFAKIKLHSNENIEWMKYFFKCIDFVKIKLHSNENIEWMK